MIILCFYSNYYRYVKVNKVEKISNVNKVLDFHVWDKLGFG